MVVVKVVLGRFQKRTFHFDNGQVLTRSMSFGFMRPSALTKSEFFKLIAAVKKYEKLPLSERRKIQEKEAGGR